MSYLRAGKRHNVSRQESTPLWDLDDSPPARGSARQRAGRGTRSPTGRRGAQEPAAKNPIARVIVDISLAHLDRTFDYKVPARCDAAAVPGCRVRVRFAGQLVDGFLVERVSESEHTGRLAFLERVTSAERVLTADLARLCRLVADRYGGTMVDVLRLAIPPRHATVEAEQERQVASSVESPVTTGWVRYPRGAALIEALRNGRTAHAVWQALPGEDWPMRLAEAVAVVAARGRGALVVVPDQRDLTRLHDACTRLLGADAVVSLFADLGPAERYRRWLAVSRGAVRAVVGTRAAMFAPVVEPGLFIVWDDGDDVHVDPHMPYPQVRDVLIWRAHASGASLVAAGFARTAEAQLLIESGWAHPIVADRTELRLAAPRVTPVGEDFDVARDEAARSARLPAVAFEAARQALRANAPVLVQVPRRGYVPVLACGHCRAPARCRRCAGPLALPSRADRSSVGHATCSWCGVVEANVRCSACGSPTLRAVVVGAKRTAEELGRAFPDVPVRTSDGAEVLASVSREPSLTVCTPGAEPPASGGYGAALLLDGWALLGRQDLRAGEETLRRWMGAAALVRPGSDGGRVVVGADSALTTVQALIRWDPGWHAELELAERSELAFPPVSRMASVEGSSGAVSALLDEIVLPEPAEILGPVPIGAVDGEGNGERDRVLLRVPRSEGKALAAAVQAANASRNARKEQDPVRIQLDPRELI